MIRRPPEGVESALRRAELLVAKAVGFAISLDAGGVELPGVATSQADAAQLRAIAALYLASELEAAGVVSATEDLVRLVRTGALALDLGDAAPLLERFWLSRNERATEAERRHFFTVLFEGSTTGARESGIDDLFIDLCEALYKLDEHATVEGWGGVAQQSRVRTRAARLLEALAAGATGMTAFFASEVLATLRQSIAIVTHESVRAAFGVRGPEEVVAAVLRRVRRAAPGPWNVHVRRGQAGMTILAWLADAAPLLASSRPLLGLDHPVIAAAIDWLELSLELSGSSQASRPAEGAPTDWASLGR